MLVLPSSNLLLWWVRSFLVDKLLQLSLSDKSFYLLLQVIAVKCVIVVVMVKAAILVFGPLIGVSLQHVGKCHGSFVLDLHQDLVNGAVSEVNLVNLPVGGLERLSSHRSLVLIVFCPPSCCASFCLSLFLGFSSRANSASSAFIYLVAL